MIPKNKFVPVHHAQGDCYYLDRQAQLAEPCGFIFRCRLWMRDLGNPPSPATNCKQQNPDWVCTQQ